MGTAELTSWLEKVFNITYIDGTQHYTASKYVVWRELDKLTTKEQQE